MRALIYEGTDGKIYKTLAEAPKGATVKFVDVPEDKAKYDADRIAKWRMRKQQGLIQGVIK